ncbi:hypothetical protein E2C01_040287 [Portunus trituberculatus]|uniref:Uncharacterized protein n=1 Tax=Portunus trituberculatus TaxID=210409 RepID=A0A5B7FM90_PORTR|nr:hypothetical protein [Portunus trituberculatus]
MVAGRGTGEMERLCGPNPLDNLHQVNNRNLRSLSDASKASLELVGEATSVRVGKSRRKRGETWRKVAAGQGVMRGHGGIRGNKMEEGAKRNEQEVVEEECKGMRKEE